NEPRAAANAAGAAAASASIPAGTLPATSGSVRSAVPAPDSRLRPSAPDTSEPARIVSAAPAVEPVESPALVEHESSPVPAAYHGRLAAREPEVPPKVGAAREPMVTTASAPSSSVSPPVLSPEPRHGRLAARSNGAALEEAQGGSAAA